MPLHNELPQRTRGAGEFQFDDAPVVCRGAFVDACELRDVRTDVKVGDE